MGNVFGRGRRAAASAKQQASQEAAAAAAAARPLALTDVERTAVGVSYYRQQAAKRLQEQGVAPFYNSWYDAQLCADLSKEGEDYLDSKVWRSIPNMVVARTVALDDALMRATGGPATASPPAADQGPAPPAPDAPHLPLAREPKQLSALPVGTIRQVVVLGAGLDTRAWRLAWPQGVTVFEVDTGSVEALKWRKFGQVPLSCAARHALVADLNDLPRLTATLAGAGFKPTEPTVWVLEGLIGYLTHDAGNALLSKAKALSAPGSHFLMTCPPSPEDKERSEKDSHKLYHAVFEWPQDTLARVKAAGWSSAELVTTEVLGEAYGLETKQPHIHALA